MKNPAVCSVRLSERTSAFRAEKNGSTPLPSTTSPKYKGTNIQAMLRQVNMQVNKPCPESLVRECDTELLVESVC